MPNNQQKFKTHTTLLTHFPLKKKKKGNSKDLAVLTVSLILLIRFLIAPLYLKVTNVLHIVKCNGQFSPAYHLAYQQHLTQPIIPSFLKSAIFPASLHDRALSRLLLLGWNHLMPSASRTSLDLLSSLNCLANSTQSHGIKYHHLPIADLWVHILSHGFPKLLPPFIR